MPGQDKTVSKSGKEVMNIKQVAEYLGVHTSTIYKSAQKGTIPAFKIGSDWRFSAKYIDLWIDEKMANNGK
jgi:excisionase family DNA binding protein